jgi:hypothetical protein
MVEFNIRCKSPAGQWQTHLDGHKKVNWLAFFEGLNCLDPPFLDAVRMEALKHFLEPQYEGQDGCPKGGLSRNELAVSILTVRRTDLPYGSVEALAAYLSTHTDQPKETLRDARVELNRRRLRERNTLIRGLYRVFYGVAVGDGPWHHPLIGEIEPLAEPNEVRSDRAIQLTHRWLNDNGYRPPSQGRMRNLITENW